MVSFEIEKNLERSRTTRKRFNKKLKPVKGFGILMTAIFCFIDQRIASLLYFHYSRNLSLYKCCLAKFGCTTIIVIFQILFNRQCFLRKQPIVRSNVNDIEMSYPQTDEPTLNVSRHDNSQITQPSRFQKKTTHSKLQLELQTKLLLLTLDQT